MPGGLIPVFPAPADVQIFSGPNVAGKADPTVCGAGGTAAATATIKVSVDGAGAAASALVLDVGLNNAGGMNVWAPDTTYRLQFAATAKVTAKQGGDGAFPADYKLCFHTPAAP